MNVLNLFPSPLIKDQEEKTKIYFISRVVLIVAFLALLALSVMVFTDFNGLFAYDYLLFAMTLLIFIYLMVLKNNVELVSVLFIFTSWIGMTAIAGTAEGIHDATIIGYIVVIFYASLISGYKLALTIGGLSIISVWILAYIEIIGYIKFQIDKPFHVSRDFTIIIILAITLIILYEKSFLDLYNRIKKELQERKKVEEKLLQNEIILKKQNEEYISLNEELTESNNRIKGMNRDLRIAKEKAEESDRLKTAFLQNISHEIRTPLNGIIGFNELLRNSSPSEEEKLEYIDFIKTSSLNLAKLMDDLMDISRIDAGVIDLHISGFNLIELFKELENSYSGKAEEKGLQLSFHCDLNKFEIETDKGRLVQILNYLLSNAIKFTRSGFIKVHANQLDNSLVITVTDSGIGIKNENLEAIFNRFTQADMDLTRTHGGTGLGLSIAKGLVEHLGGNLIVKSEYGKGSEFAFNIPVIFKSADQIELPVSKGSDKLFTKKIKILIAEDEDINFFYLVEILKHRNCIIIRAHNGKEAIDKVMEHQDFDIILMDIRMPLMNGYDASCKIKEINKQIPIIALTAFATKEDKQNLSKINFDDYLAKPITPGELFKRINNLLNNVR
jgi:signal transduction histidine kinase